MPSALGTKYLSTEWAEQLTKALDADERAKPYATDQDTLFQMNVEGGPDGDRSYFVHVNNGSIVIAIDSPRGEPDITGTLSYEHASQLLKGELDGTAAMMTGKLKVEGEMARVLKAANALNLVPEAASTIDIDY